MTGKDIEKASVDYQMSIRPMAIGGDAFDDMIYRININPSFISGAEWVLNHLWYPADGDNLPEIDREVIALIEAFGHYKVTFAHRVDENAKVHTSIDGKPLVLHPMRYDKGGWNIQGVKYWLDLELPKMEK